MRHRISRRIAIVGATIALALAAPLGVALAAHFSDVPNSNPFHADIQALADSGVTTGCGGTNFCPKGLVNREQMAAFMNRLGALGPGKTPVVNADKVDGLDASAFHRYGANAPANAMMTGTFTVAGDRGGGAQDFGVDSIVWPVPLASAPIVHVVPVGGPNPSGCSGSATAPNASAGHLCLFLGSVSNATSTAVCNPVANSCGSSSRLGAVVETFAVADGSFVSTGSWAVRAPLTLTLQEDSTQPTGPTIGERPS